MKKFYSLLVALFVIVVSSPAFAAFPPATLTELDLTAFETVAGLVIVGVAAIWAIVKGISILRGR